jgi:hypothetical protein
VRNVPGGATPNRPLCSGSGKPVAADPYQRAACPTCGGYYLVRHNGKMRNHYRQER